LDRALDLFDRALVVRPEREKTMYHLGRVLFDMKTFERSKLLFEQVFELVYLRSTSAFAELKRPASRKPTKYHFILATHRFALMPGFRWSRVSRAK
jgi:hypothetical protein